MAVPTERVVLHRAATRGARAGIVKLRAAGTGPPPGETIMWIKINGVLQPVTGITKST